MKKQPFWDVRTEAEAIKLIDVLKRNYKKISFSYHKRSHITNGKIWYRYHLFFSCHNHKDIYFTSFSSFVQGYLACQSFYHQADNVLKRARELRRKGIRS